MEKQIKNFAIICPGQGSQTPAMLKDFYDNFIEFKQSFEEASDYLHYDLWHIIKTNPENKLNQTQFTQPALLVASLALWRVWQVNSGILPQAIAGHSLGEYSALVIAEALTFQQGVELINLRANIMAQIGEKLPGAMAAIIGLAGDKVQDICQNITDAGNLVEAVNFNSSQQIVIAGTKPGVEQALTECKTNGAKLTSLLPVSVAAHSSLMQAGSEELSQALQNSEFKMPSIDFYQNVTAQKVASIEELKANLALQLYSPVRWHQIIDRIAKTQITTFVEMGAGKVLTGLNKRIDKSFKTFNTNGLKDWDASLEAIHKL